MGRSETEVLIGRIVQRIRGYPVDYRGDLQAAVSICKLRILSFQFSVFSSQFLVWVRSALVFPKPRLCNRFSR